MGKLCNCVTITLSESFALGKHSCVLATNLAILFFSPSKCLQKENHLRIALS